MPDVVLRDEIKISNSEKDFVLPIRFFTIDTKTERKIRLLISQESNMNYQSSFNMNSIMPKLKENLQYLNKIVRSNSHFRVIWKIVSDVDEV